MAVTWEWNNKVGEYTNERGGKSVIFSGGNTDIVAMLEYEKEDDKFYYMSFFFDFSDKEYVINTLNWNIDVGNITEMKLNLRHKKTIKLIQALQKCDTKEVKIHLE